MKKILFILFIILCSSFTETKNAVPCTVRTGYLVDPANTSDTEIQFCDIPVGQYRIITITMPDTNTDSIAFSVGTAITASHAKYGPGEKSVWTVRNGYENLHYKADDADDKFKTTH